MSTFVRMLAIVLAALAVISGIFAEAFLSIPGVRIHNPAELRWPLMVGMPVVLLVAYASFNRQPAKTALAATVQSIGLLALFLAPYWWLMRHVD